ncbi:sulfur carrier protein ThiS [Pelagibacterales bacterium SAG-MED07]|nr:sulfur carrier protein ThiS [Pelagibacterales bacterium SAG-MED07]
MKKINKIEIYINGKKTLADKGAKLSNLIKDLNIPLKKVAIELNQAIVDKKRLNIIKLKKYDKIEIVHFIGGG